MVCALVKEVIPAKQKSRKIFLISIDLPHVEYLEIYKK
jgi:hypothetical protein